MGSFRGVQRAELQGKRSLGARAGAGVPAWEDGRAGIRKVPASEDAPGRPESASGVPPASREEEEEEILSFYPVHRLAR